MKFVSPSIVTNGLVLCYDAANVKSYPGSGVVLSDLSGGVFNGTLANGTGFSSANAGQLTFDGINDVVDTSYAAILTDFTVGIWFKVPDSTNGSTARLLDKNHMLGFWMGSAFPQTPNLWGGGIMQTSPPYGLFIPLTDGVWHYLVMMRSGTTKTVYGDGITNTASETVSGAATNTNTLRLGVDDVGSSSVQLKGSIAMVQLYNRALTSTEVLQNFNATRGRFGI